MDINGHINHNERTNVSFTTKHNIDEIVELLRKQYDDKLVEKMDDKKIYLSTNNNVISIDLIDTEQFLWSKRNVYCARIESFALSGNNDDSSIYIPFPKEYLKIEGGYSGEMDISCDKETIVGFYKHFTNVTVEDNVITIYQQPKVEIYVEEGKIKVNLV